MDVKVTLKKRIIGIDPGLRHTGWGVIDIDGNHMTHIANGTISTNDKAEIAQRLLTLHNELSSIISVYQPDISSIEKVFVNKNALSSLKLGHARGALIVTLAAHSLMPGEYDATKVKKTVTGNGRAGKDQVSAMVQILLPGVDINSADSADALAVAICHTQHMNITSLYKEAHSPLS